MGGQHIERESIFMKSMTAGELRAMFLRFFQEKGHQLIPSASVIPENDPTCTRWYPI
jgi:alanyl-tRNA synthetase